MSRSSHVVTAILLLACCVPAWAHGGAYSNPAGPGLSSPGGARAGSSSGATATRAPTAPGSGRGATTGASIDFIPDEGSWERWWIANRDGYLRLRDALGQRTLSGSSASALTGRGRHVTAPAGHGADRATVDQVIVPALIALLATSDEPDVLDSAVLAAARSAGSDRSAEVLAAIRPLLGHADLSVQSAATLALGVLGDDGARDALRAQLRDDSAGRAVAGGAVPTRTRAFAAFALGLIGRPVDALLLAQIVERSPDSEREVKAACILALGLLGEQDAVANAVQATLLLQLADRRLDPMVRGHVPTALARTGDPALLPELLAAFRERDASQDERRSEALAFGRLATPSDAAVVEALLDALDDGGDGHLRHFAIIALGEIGARDASAPAPDEAKLRERILDRLLDETHGKGRSREQRSWGALGAALYARGQPAAQPRVVEHLRDAYADESDPYFKGAMAIALGLVGDGTSGEALLSDLHEVQDHRFRRHAAVALGMLRHEAATDALRALLVDANTHPELRVECAMALGLLGSTSSLDLFVRALEESRSLGETAGIAQALGLIGDTQVVAPLLQLANDPQRPALSRAFACVALGLLGERGLLPFQAALLAHENYLSECEALQELMSIL